MGGKSSFVLLLCFLSVSFVNCQFGLFQRDRDNNHRRLPVISSIANSIGNIFRPNQNKPIENQDNQNQPIREQQQPAVIFPTNENPEQYQPSKVNVFDNNGPTSGLRPIPNDQPNAPLVLPEGPAEEPNAPLVLPEGPPEEPNEPLVLPEVPPELPNEASEAPNDAVNFGDNPSEEDVLGNKHGQDGTTIQFSTEPVFSKYLVAYYFSWMFAALGGGEHN